MIQKMMYICSKCQQAFYEKNECIKHEAAHVGLTSDEYKTWARLLNKAHKASITVSMYNNEDTRTIEEKAINELLNFETKHKLNDENGAKIAALSLRGDLYDGL